MSDDDDSGFLEFEQHDGDEADDDGQAGGNGENQANLAKTRGTNNADGNMMEFKGDEEYSERLSNDEELKLSQSKNFFLDK